MENCVGIKFKRKDLEDVNDDFSDFSLSSPARKMRRLNAELPPIIEEEAEMHIGYEQSLPTNSIPNDFIDQGMPPVIEELPCVPENEEKAIVLYKPMNSSITCTQGMFSVDPKLISCFKNQAFWGNQLNSGRPREDDEANGNNGEEIACRAVIPWVLPETHSPVLETLAPQTEVSDAMDAEEVETSTMEIEDADADPTNVGNSNISRFNEGLQHQWFQQHCMIPQPPENTTTPIVWYR